MGIAFGRVAGVAAMTALVGGLLAAPSAAATVVPGGRIVYVCGDNLCAVDPSTGGQQQITTDARGYRTPDVTADGALVAADVADDVFVGAYGTNLPEMWASSRSVSDVAIAADGSGVAESHSYVQNVYCYPGGLCLRAFNDTDYTPRGGAEGTERSYDGGNGAAFTASGALLSGTYDLDRDLHAVCVVATPALEDQECIELFNGPSSFTSFDVTGDGAWVAATVTPEVPAGQTAVSSVELFSTAIGTATPAQSSRVVAAGAGSPTFSPDGTWLSYASADGWIYAVPTAGGIAPVRLVQGISPAWGGGAIAGSTPPATPPATPPVTDPPGTGDDGSGTAGIVKAKGVVKVKKNKVPVTISCVGATSCSGKVTVTLKGKALTKPAAYDVKPGAKKTVKVKLTARGAKLLPKGRKVTVKVAVSGAGKKAKAKVAIRR